MFHIVGTLWLMWSFWVLPSYIFMQIGVSIAVLCLGGKILCSFLPCYLPIVCCNEIKL